MPFPKFNPKPEQVPETTPAKVANPLKTPAEPCPERDPAPSLDAAKPVLNLLNSDTNPWREALSQVEHLAAKLVELGAPVLRVDVEHIARGYQLLAKLPPQQVHQVVRWTLEALEREYPEPRSVEVIAQTPGRYPEPIQKTILWQWHAEHQPAEPEPEAPQLADWAAALLEAADREQVQYPLLLELLDFENGVQSLTRLCESRYQLVATLGELSRYTPREARLLKPETLEPLGMAHG